MKKTQEIIGLPIISISDGMEVGKVKSIIINADKGAIDYIVVDSGIQILSARVIPTDSVQGIGEYALTIENENAINDISKIPAAIDLLQKNIQVKGTKVLTKKGRLIGEIGDIYIDEDECCKITGLEYIADITQKRIRLIPRKSVITFGKNLVVVTEDVESTLVDKITELATGEGSLGAEKKNLTDSDSGNLGAEIVMPDSEESNNYVAPVDYSSSLPHIEKIVADGEALYKDNTAENEKQESRQQSTETYTIEADTTDSLKNNDTNLLSGFDTTVGQEAPDNGGMFPGQEQIARQDVQPASDAQTESSAANLFEQRQRQYLNGRRATKTIVDNNGNTIVSEGTLIDNGIIDMAKESGKLIELVMNNKA